MSEIGHNGIGLDRAMVPAPAPMSTEAALFHLLIACGVTLEGTDTQERLRQAYQNINERFTKARECEGQRERIAYLEELNRRLERYAAFDADGYVAANGVGCISVCCRNCGHCFPLQRAQYEQLQRETHERNGRIDL